MIEIIYNDELGLIAEKVDMYGIQFLEGKAIFNENKIDMNRIIEIKEIGIGRPLY